MGSELSPTSLSNSVSTSYWTRHTGYLPILVGLTWKGGNSGCTSTWQCYRPFARSFRPGCLRLPCWTPGANYTGVVPGGGPKHALRELHARGYHVPVLCICICWAGLRNGALLVITGRTLSYPSGILVRYTARDRHGGRQLRSHTRRK